MTLIESFDEAELKYASKDISPNRAGGHDAIPPELLSEMWDSMGADLTTVIEEVLRKGGLEDSFKRKVTTLIPKGGSMVFIRNYRPISMLTRIYKLIAKTLAIRVQEFLRAIIIPTRTWFVKEHCILDNLFLAYDSIYWARESNQDLVVVLLDYKQPIIE